MSETANTTPPIDLLGDWRRTCNEIVTRSHYVRLSTYDTSMISTKIKAADLTIDSWRVYVPDVAQNNPDSSQLVFEMALKIANLGGFITSDIKGMGVKWGMDGSGVKAIHEAFKRIRTKLGVNLSAADAGLARSITSDVYTDMKAPNIDARLEIIDEIFSTEVKAHLTQIAERFNSNDNTRITVQDLQHLAAIAPKSFGGDPFFKKAALFFNKLQSAFSDLGKKCETDILPPSEYRNAQFLIANGTIRVTDKRLENDINTGRALDVNDPAVQDIRAATCLAIADIAERTGRTINAVDSAIYALSRTNPPQGRHMMLLGMAL